MWWLREVPLAVVVAHFEMMDELMAEESLLEARRTGTGVRLNMDAGRQMAAWRRASGGSGRVRPVPATAGELADMGIMVVSRG